MTDAYKRYFGIFFKEFHFSHANFMPNNSFLYFAINASKYLLEEGYKFLHVILVIYIYMMISYYAYI